jgi:cytochrome c oxidase assembly factor 5
MNDSVIKVFTKIDEQIGPSRKDYKPACHEDREMLLECVM